MFNNSQTHCSSYIKHMGNPGVICFFLFYIGMVRLIVDLK